MLPWAVLLAVGMASGARAQVFDPNACDAPGDAPDIIVGDIYELINWGRVGDVTGYSMGGYGSFDWIAAEPTLFAAAAPIAGFPGPDMAKRLPKSTALWLFWGELDQADRAKALRDAIKAAGIPCQETEYQGADHVSYHYKTATDPAVHEWLFSQKRTLP